MPSVPVIYEDEFLIVVDKPPGMVVDPSETQATGTLADILKEEFKIGLERGGIVHRLDKDTSGLLLVAKTQEVLENLQAQFKDRTVKKEYLALSHGKLEKEELVVGNIIRNPKNREKFIISRDEEGKPSETLFTPIKNLKLENENLKDLFGPLNKNQQRKLDRSNYGIFTLIRAFPRTGRTHQIRVHLKYIGFPIVGDEKYAGRKTSRYDKRWCPRQFLHAAKITFTHPKTGELLSFEAPLPDDMQNVLSKLVS